MELNILTSTTVSKATWDESKKRWTVTIVRTLAGETIEREFLNSSAFCLFWTMLTNLEMLYPRHIIQATGISGEPKIPKFPGMDKFKGDGLVHSSAFRGAKDCQGKKVVIIGACNSANDIAEDYHLHGAEVTIVQRSSTFVISRDTIRLALSAARYSEDGVSILFCLMAAWP